MKQLSIRFYDFSNVDWSELRKWFPDHTKVRRRAAIAGWVTKRNKLKNKYDERKTK